MLENKKKNKLKRLEEWLGKHKVLVISAIIVVVLFLVVFGANLILYINFLLGNDIIVKLDVDKKDLYLEHGQEEYITFEAKVTTNPFCTALCKSGFIDISNNSLIDRAEFTLKPSKPIKKEYLIKPRQIGTGLDLYRFDMECHSIGTLLCHTNEEPSTRNILITVQYNLTKLEKQLKETLKEQLENLTNQLGIYEGEEVVFEELSNELNNTLIFDDPSIITKEKLIQLRNKMRYLKEVWEKQDYYLLANETEKFESESQDVGILLAEANNSLSATVSFYNEIIDNLNNTRENLEKIRELVRINSTRASEINKLIDEFNDISELFLQKTTLAEKRDLADSINETTALLVASTKTEMTKEVLKRELELDINYDALCEITKRCMQHPSIEERANQSELDLRATCKGIEDLRELFTELNNTIKDELSNQNYPDTEDFWKNINSKIRNIKQNITSKYLEKLPENKSNTALIGELLVESPFIETEDYKGYNLNPALLTELVKQQPSNCDIANITISSIKEINISKIQIKETLPISSDIIFEEPNPKCCVFGKCQDCCITNECKQDPSKFPVVFLHGHAVDKSVSAEYSLEGFNDIQKKLEEDGYLNTGTVTLFTELDSKKRIWGLLPIPLTIRTSYYFDIFREPENYVVVQTKSENIDTYAIRLKELIDTIKFKTDRPKVNIIAFSMGGLVARRYVQIFGPESVDKLILIGTPNKGIVGDIADYCPVTGEALECKDMNSESLFINKLNRGNFPEIKVYNIVGTGCAMEKGMGDGIVLEEKAWLEGAHNYIINGTCSSKINPLHINLRDINLYPEVYKIIKDALEGNIQE